MFLHLFSLELQWILKCSCKLDSIHEVSSSICNWVSDKRKKSLPNKCVSFTISLQCFLKDRVFSNVILNVISETHINSNVVSLHSHRSHWYSFFVEEFPFIDFLLYFSRRYMLFILVIQVTGTYIWPGLRDFWQCSQNLSHLHPNSDTVLYEQYMLMTMLVETEFF